MKILGSTDPKGRSGGIHLMLYKKCNFAGLLRALRNGAMTTGSQVIVDLGKEGEVQVIVGKHLGRYQFELVVNWHGGAEEGR